MSSGGNVNQPNVQPTAPAAAPGQVGGANEGTADFYRKAVEAKPTGFAENPIGAMAHAVDRFGKAAGNLVQGKELEGRDGLAAGEDRLRRANAAVKANASQSARQEQLAATLSLFHDMQKLSPNDPRRVKVAGFLVQLATQMSADGLSLKIPGMDSIGMLRLAAQLTSRFGDAAGMQSAFALEGLLAGLMPETSVEGMRLRDQLVQQLGLSPSAAKLIAAGWAVRLAHGGEVPTVDISQRTLVLDAQQENLSLGAIARAYWHDTSMANPADKDGFIQAFLKIAGQGGFSVLNRKYRDLRRMARHEVSSGRGLAVGGVVSRPSGSAGRTEDESGDMFAALAQFSRADGGASLPDTVRPVLERFYRSR